jgi:hypothetical protein
MLAQLVSELVLDVTQVFRPQWRVEPGLGGQCVDR